MTEVVAIATAAIASPAIGLAASQHPSAAELAKTYLSVSNSRDHAKFQKWVATYAEPGISRLENGQFKSSAQYGPYVFKKVVFDQPYEMIAKLTANGKPTSLTMWFDSKGKVRYILMVQDLYP